MRCDVDGTLDGRGWGEAAARREHLQPDGRLIGRINLPELRSQSLLRRHAPQPPVHGVEQERHRCTSIRKAPAEVS
jgi:hypothetical protein